MPPAYSRYLCGLEKVILTSSRSITKDLYEYSIISFTCYISYLNIQVSFVELSLGKSKKYEILGTKAATIDYFKSNWMLGAMR